MVDLAREGAAVLEHDPPGQMRRRSVLAGAAAGCRFWEELEPRNLAHALHPGRHQRRRQVELAATRALVHGRRSAAAAILQEFAADVERRHSGAYDEDTASAIRLGAAVLLRVHDVLRPPAATVAIALAVKRRLPRRQPGDGGHARQVVVARGNDDRVEGPRALLQPAPSLVLALLAAVSVNGQRQRPDRPLARSLVLAHLLHPRVVQSHSVNAALGRQICHVPCHHVVRRRLGRTVGPPAQRRHHQRYWHVVAQPGVARARRREEAGRRRGAIAAVDAAVVVVCRRRLARVRRRRRRARVVPPHAPGRSSALKHDHVDRTARPQQVRCGAHAAYAGADDGHPRARRQQRSIGGDGALWQYRRGTVRLVCVLAY